MPKTRRAFLKHATSLAISAGIAPMSLRAQTRDRQLDALAADVAARSVGRVVRGGDAGHGAIKYYNARFDCLRDTAYIRPTTVDGVRAAIAWANQHDRKFAIRGAGHSFEGKSSHPELVIDMSQMSKLTFRDGILDVEAGVQLGQVYKVISAAGYVLPGGTCPTVGLIGHTLGGGIGDFLPMFGYAAQSLRSAVLVTMSGTHMKVTDDAIDVLAGPALPRRIRPADLMRALRGGGQGAFGVITNMTFKATDVRQANIASFKFDGAGDMSQRKAVALLQAWFKWRETLPKVMQSVVSAKLNLSRSGNSYGVDIAGLIVIPNGSDTTMTAVRRTLDPLYQASEFSQKKFEADLDATGAIKTFVDDDETTTNSKRQMLYGSSAALDKALPPDAIRHLIQNLRSNIFASFYTSGGQTKAAPQTSLHPSEFLIEWSTYAPRRDTSAHRRIRDLHGGVMRVAGAKDQAFPNYPDSDARDYFVDRGKLEALRTLLDPDALSTSSLLSRAPPTDSRCR